MIWLVGCNGMLGMDLAGRLNRQGMRWKGSDREVDIRDIEALRRYAWHGVTLSEENHSMLYIPPGFAHGFVTLSRMVHLLYKCIAEYNRGSEGGIRWNDPDIAIEWPLKDVIISDRDTALPLFKDLA